MKTLKYLLFAVLALSISMACSEDVVSGTDISDDETGLTGTKWQLAAFIDVQTRESIEPEPKDCNRCYTLEFDSDTTATGKSALNTLHFIVTPSTIEMSLMTEIGDSHYGNVDLYYEALQTLDTYECNKDELKIYYAEKKKYLL
ncbi:MAG: hypothetical protein LBS46_02540, partial [Dysgonamonadaceae bacterium]|nr:hypothetical protein [Dysgonamonadaceae bacterium]